MPSEPPRDWRSLHDLTKSDADRRIAGICGGLGEHTPVPAWLWRVLFLVGILCAGATGVAYVLLWIYMPPPPPRRR
jgi:phage shock protein PspC (stress-responsive transcriptional regulator)